MIGNALVLAIREIRRNMMRASLTTLGVIIGVAAVIAMVTLGNGATQSVTSSIGSLGRNLLILAPGTRRMGGAQSDASPFDPGDVEAVRRDITGLRAVAAVAMRSEIVVAGNQNHPTQITGTDNSYFDARDWPLAAGRIFTDAEMRSGRSVCIIGQTIRTTLFGSQNPLGANIRVRDVPCDVVGILSAKGQSTFGQDQDDLVVMPIRAVQRRLAGNTNVGTIWIAAERPEDVTKIKQGLTDLMRERRHLSPGTPDDFQANDMAQITQIMQTTTGILTLFLSAVAAVSLLVGGIGIMNIMLVSVTERTREIGIRLAIGARERDVLTQFLVEAVMMSALGGLVGIAFGLGASAAGTHFLKIPFVPSVPIVVIAFLFSAGIGVAFGYFPARRAARLDPIDALRHE
ncbi:MAG TPA: ABC transporter permease [Micropepsaceae bacterium]|jgi:putative ABC transport system permease protein|nr:ABC transporter permease [Micropepsaceae bacterium]